MATHIDYVLIRKKDEEIVQIVKSLPARVFLPDVPFRADFSKADTVGEYELRERRTEIAEPTLAERKAAAIKDVNDHVPQVWITNKAQAQTALQGASSVDALLAVQKQIDWKNLK
jgi:hypothetical protein